MGLGDRIRAFFRGERKARKIAPSVSAETKQARRDLEAFAADHPGVEAYLEPKTAIYPPTLLFVAGSGQYLRRPIGDKATAVEFCKKLALPMYEAAKVGYPKRMRDWDQGKPKEEVALDDLPPWPGDDDTTAEVSAAMAKTAEQAEPDRTPEPDDDADVSGDVDDSDDENDDGPDEGGVPVA